MLSYICLSGIIYKEICEEILIRIPEYIFWPQLWGRLKSRVLDSSLKSRIVHYTEDGLTAEVGIKGYKL